MFKTAVAIAAAVATSTVSGYAVYPELCGAAELLKLAGILFTNGADLNECQAKADGWKFIPPVSLPTIEQQTRMCKSPACTNLLVAIQKLNPADCFLSTNNSAVGINVKQFTDEYQPFCDLFGL